MINDNDNEAENEKYDIYRARPRHEHKYTKYKVCLSIMMVTCIKQHLNNNWNSIHEKVKEHWGWVEKKHCLSKEKRVFEKSRPQIDDRL